MTQKALMAMAQQEPKDVVVVVRDIIDVYNFHLRETGDPVAAKEAAVSEMVEVIGDLKANEQPT